MTDKKLPLHVYMLVPHLQTTDANLEYYYDFSSSISEFTEVFKNLEINWTWQPVTIQDYKEKIDEIAQQKNNCNPLVFNLCDGDEVNGAPGVSVIHYLVKAGLAFTGSDAFFYDITTSKIPMKKLFDEHQVAHANWEAIYTPTQNIAGIFDRIGSPLIVKPAVSAGSMGLGIKNVVDNESQLETLIQQMFQGHRGWDFSYDGLVAEEFIAGPEYTVLIVGSAKNKASAFVYPPVERLFHPALPEREQFLSYDRLWEFYEDEKPIGNHEDFYNYFPVEPQLAKQIVELSWQAYASLGGTGYGRVDIRMNKNTKQLFVLEVNAQCGLSDDENYTSIGAILRLSKNTYTNLIKRIMDDALAVNNEQLTPKNG